MHIQHDFQSLSEWALYCEQELPADKALPCSSHNFQSNFTKVSTRKEAFELFYMGFPEGLANTRKILEQLQETITLDTFTDHFEQDVSGSAPNVEATIQGIPEDMFVMSQIEQTAPPSFLQVQFELVYSSWITPEQATLAGAIMLAAIEALRAQGCNLEILMTHTTKSHGETWQSSVPLPSNIDMDTLSFLFSHPASLRIMSFAAMEHEPAHVRSQFGSYVGGGYGSCHSIKNPRADVLLTMQSITDRIKFGNQGETILSARALLKELIDTRFGTLKTEGVPVN